MPTQPKSEFKLIEGKIVDIKTQLAAAGHEGWRPILMTATAVPSGPVSVPVVFVILEHVRGT